MRGCLGRLTFGFVTSGFLGVLALRFTMRSVLGGLAFSFAARGDLGGLTGGLGEKPLTRVSILPFGGRSAKFEEMPRQDSRQHTRCDQQQNLND
jgi:hypothetical protein